VAYQQHAAVPRRFRFRQGHGVASAAVDFVRHQRTNDHRWYGQRHAKAQHYHILHDDGTDLWILEINNHSYNSAYVRFFLFLFKH